MGKQFNIKDARTIELAHDLALRNGKSVTATIRDVLEAEHKRVNDEVEQRVANIMAIGARFRAALPPELRTLSSKEWMDKI